MNNAFSVVTLIFSLLAFSVQAQDDTTGLYLFNRGRSLYEKGQRDSALAVWSIIVDKKIGYHYDIYGDALFNIPNIYWEMGNYEKAKVGYKRVLASDLGDDAETGSLMEPHTNYKHKAAVALAGLYQKEADYVEVLGWLSKAQEMYPYWGFEGSATNISKEEAYLLDWKTNVFLKLNRRSEAIREIILDLIYAEYPDEFFKKSQAKFFSLVDKKIFISSFNKALSNLKISVITNGAEASFVFQGLKYQIKISKKYPPRNLPHFFHSLVVPKSQAIISEYVIDYIKRQSFYVHLSQ